MPIQSLFQGRIDRKNYSLLVVFLASIIFSAFVLLPFFFEPSSVFVMASLGVLCAFSFLLVWVMSVRRLHDIGKTGRYIWFYFIPGLNALFVVVMMFAKPVQLKNKHGIPVPKTASFFEVLKNSYNEQTQWSTKTSQKNKQGRIKQNRNILH